MIRTFSRCWRLALVLAITGLSLAAQPVSQSANRYRDEHPWAMRRSDAARTGQSTAVGPVQGTLAWSRMMRGDVPSMAVGRSGRIYLGATFHDKQWTYENYVHALTPGGEVAWRVKVPSYDWGFSQGVRSGPALDAAERPMMNSSKSMVLRFHGLGQTDLSIARSSNAIMNSSPVIAPDGTFFHYHWIDGGLTKYTEDGQILWSVSFNSNTDPAVAPNGDLVMGGVFTREPHGSTDITYINANGTVRWIKSSSNGRDSQPIFGPDGTVYQGAGAYTPAGTVKWGTPNGADAALGRNGFLYVAAGSQLTAYRASDGLVIWQTTTPSGYSILPEMAIDSLDRLYVTTAGGEVYGFTASGSVMLSLKVCEAFETGPVLGANRDLIAFGRNGFDNYVFSVR
ncbi:MAG: PQQ-binding-like beta-propeller repeat protein [Planctomycetota bacterium]